MFKSGILLILGLGLAVGIPVMLTDGDGAGDGLLSKIKGWFSGDEESEGKLDYDPLASEKKEEQADPFAPPDPKLAGVAVVQDLVEVFRFDITPGWVASRWTRVSTAPGGVNLQGFRVPLVTGSKDKDLRGSLTYYFDQKRMQRLTFVGRTGDARPIVSLAMNRYGMKLKSTKEPGAALYQKVLHGRVINELTIRVVDVVRTDQPQNRFDVDLDIMQPDFALAQKTAKR